VLTVVSSLANCITLGEPTAFIGFAYSLIALNVPALVLLFLKKRGLPLAICFFITALIHIYAIVNNISTYVELGGGTYNVLPYLLILQAIRIFSTCTLFFINIAFGFLSLASDERKFKAFAKIKKMLFIVLMSFLGIRLVANIVFDIINGIHVYELLLYAIDMFFSGELLALAPFASMFFSSFLIWLHIVAWVFVGVWLINNPIKEKKGLDDDIAKVVA